MGTSRRMSVYATRTAPCADRRAAGTTLHARGLAHRRQAGWEGRVVTPQPADVRLARAEPGGSVGCNAFVTAARYRDVTRFAVLDGTDAAG